MEGVMIERSAADLVWLRGLGYVVALLSQNVISVSRGVSNR